MRLLHREDLQLPHALRAWRGHHRSPPDHLTVLRVISFALEAIEAEDAHTAVQLDYVLRSPARLDPYDRLEIRDGWRSPHVGIYVWPAYGTVRYHVRDSPGLVSSGQDPTAVSFPNSSEVELILFRKSLASIDAQYPRRYLRCLNLNDALARRRTTLDAPFSPSE